MNWSNKTEDRLQETMHPSDEQEFEWLMSLALDDRLSIDERARFETLLTKHEELAHVWNSWRWIDRQFAATPAIAPSSGFVQRFEARLAQQEQQRQQRVLLLSAALAVTALVMVFLAIIGIGALILFTQGQWIGEQLRILAFAYTSLQRWVTSTFETAAALARTPQAQLMGALYTLFVIVIMAALGQLLRHSTRSHNRPA
ncbi:MULTISPECIES: hypothetical protein [Caldilinea]|jgi:anti-sigma factor RsiW|uniref:Uncharacterized protein n=1 Tax=Caldilinea aerophila (strain DSM 14535 / JCM 11387 / NBRC 104270 / STL-6-O1) TaxID=926550 RepID=I0I564_CALAS|nr:MULTISPECIES: hypothetical protein [Caldilinea]MBO9391950.1 hypothetical protein [Caldilinea sp.]BAM00402.1 hypothetical protein CLDAP_23620 [Caldilinea aerophila DSM 14535 = NBRC 104270]GIV71756.1 MAG: hypothetical protein KatS3mg049_0312 [Caldilinea sp.]